MKCQGRGEEDGGGVREKAGLRSEAADGGHVERNTITWAWFGPSSGELAGSR